MRTTVNSRNLELTDALRAQIDRKLHRLERITHPDADATVELIVHASRAAETSHVAEVSLVNNGTVIRSVGAGSTMQAARSTPAPIESNATPTTQRTASHGVRPVAVDRPAESLGASLESTSAMVPRGCATAVRGFPAGPLAGCAEGATS